MKFLYEVERDKCNGSRRGKYQCSCGNIGETRLSRIIEGKRCQKCKRRKTNSYRVDGDVVIMDVSTDKNPNTFTRFNLRHLNKVIDGKGRWFATDFNKGILYVVRNVKNIKLHRHILDLSDLHLVVDHNDGNGLNNTDENIKACTQQENMCNRSLDGRNKTGINGVSVDIKDGKYVSQGAFNHRHYHLGRFDTAKEAMQARERFDREFRFNKNHGRSISIGKLS